jgi:hypothetical protein
MLEEMNLTTAATFSIGLFCGYLLRKNWFLIKSLVFGKNNNKLSPKNKSKTNDDNEINKSKDLPLTDESEDVQSNVST